MSTAPVPTSKAVRDLLSDLLGRQVEIIPRDVADPRLDPQCSVGVYRDDAKNAVAAVTADLPLSAYLAATLALTSSDAAAEVVARGGLPDAYAENLHEVLNIMGALFNAPGGPHVRFHALHVPGEPVPPSVTSFTTTIGRRLDVTLSIPGYGSGEMSLVA